MSLRLFQYSFLDRIQNRLGLGQSLIVHLYMAVRYGDIFALAATGKGNFYMNFLGGRLELCGDGRRATGLFPISTLEIPYGYLLPLAKSVW